MRRIAVLALLANGALADPVDDLLATPGDVDYGEYLSGECTTCHQASGGHDGIPPITGWAVDSFAIVMHSYRIKDLDHPVMQMIAGRLDDEQIMALAAYFATLDAP